MSDSPPTDPLAGSPFLAACRCEPHDRIPVWFMRQAGRSLPEYLAIRGTGSILEAVGDPDRATEITLQPVRRYGVDAAILYSDIVVPVHAIGFGVEIKPGVGPVAENPFRSAADLERIRPLEPDVDTPYVLETVRRLVTELNPHGVPVIGFAGAPFTVASYLVEGGPSRDWLKTKSLMHGDPDLWHQLMGRLADMAIVSLESQIEAGARSIQLFDSWAGALTVSDYRQFVMPHSVAIFDAVADLGVPRIHFGVTTGELLSSMGEAGADVVGVDWRTPLSIARQRVGTDKALQGNLDPAIVNAPWPAVEAAVRAVVAENAGHPGHVFNLGHGVMPSLDPDALKRIVELVHSLDPGGSTPPRP
ncbi:MAG: uroporphyrinogen decarboxylase [Actinomycetia bacterium]|nr:uroporphyrinogen decarboxylase [Actinomycetes bacterium]